MKLSEIHLTLSEVRKERNLSQKDIAEMLNVEQATISMYENGKRGIPLEILDEWLAMLEIDVKIIPKGYEPAKPEEDMKSDLEKFYHLKKRRNYLIAELRAQQAEKIMSAPEFGECNEEGENRFWPYSYPADPHVGLVETRYDHPQQKFLAVEYTKDEVSVYKFLTAQGVSDGESDREWLNINRIYFSEDDFLNFGSFWERKSMEMRKVTLLRKNDELPDGVEIVNTEGFAVRSLLDMQDTFFCYVEIVEEVTRKEEFLLMEAELEEIHHNLIELSLSNRLGNMSSNPQFEFWTDEDKEAIDVPLWSPERSWGWIEEGVKWSDELLDLQELQISADGDLEHDHFQVFRNEDGSRVIGLIGEEKAPAVFKCRPARGDAIYRIETGVGDLSEKELADYRAILNAAEIKKDLDSGEETLS